MVLAFSMPCATATPGGDRELFDFGLCVFVKDFDVAHGE